MASAHAGKPLTRDDRSWLSDLQKDEGKLLKVRDAVFAAIVFGVSRSLRDIPAVREVLSFCGQDKVRALLALIPQHVQVQVQAESNAYFVLRFVNKVLGVAKLGPYTHDEMKAAISCYHKPRLQTAVNGNRGALKPRNGHNTSRQKKKLPLEKDICALALLSMLRCLSLKDSLCTLRHAESATCMRMYLAGHRQTTMFSLILVHLPGHTCF